MLYVEALWVNDLDRNLIDTDRAFDHFVTVCIDEGVAKQAELEDAKRAVELSGGSFDLTKYLVEDGVTPDSLSGLYDVFSRTAEPGELLYPDAQRFLGRLQNSGALQLILTYGEVAWQEAKLRACGLGTVPHIVTNSKRKGVAIAGWRTDTVYEVTTDEGIELMHPQVVLTDDKAVSFEGLPTDAVGYLVQRGSTVLASQAGTVPAHVRRINSMDQITE